MSSSADRPINSPSSDGRHLQRSLLVVFLAGAGIGVLGGMIGLGGAEFRLPLLIGVFGFAALPAIIMNKAMSLVVVITAIPARLISVPLPEISPYLYIALNLLAGSLFGAWIGAHWATKLASKTLYRVIAGLLVLIAILLFFYALPRRAAAGFAASAAGNSGCGRWCGDRGGGGADGSRWR